MRVHEYEIPAMKRIAQLWTFPIARGSLVPTARIASHMVEFGQAQLICDKNRSVTRAIAVNKLSQIFGDCRHWENSATLLPMDGHALYD